MPRTGQPIHLQCADQDKPQPIGPPAHLMRRVVTQRRRVRPKFAIGQTLYELLLSSELFLIIAENILNQNDRRIHDDAEIDCADGEQVGALAVEHQQDNGEE